MFLTLVQGKLIAGVPKISVNLDIVETGGKMSTSAKDASCNFATGVDAPCGASIYYAGDYYL
jgi:hypothetical protein